jgi:hypothetical protein
MNCGWLNTGLIKLRDESSLVPMDMAVAAPIILAALLLDFSLSLLY